MPSGYSDNDIRKRIDCQTISLGGGTGREANICKTAKFQLLKTLAPTALKSFTKSG